MRSIRRDFHRYGSARELSELGMKLANRRPVSHYGPSSESSDSDSDNNSTSVPTRTQVPEDVNLQHDEQSQARTTEKKEAVTASDLDSEKEEGVLTTKRYASNFLIQTRQPCTPFLFDGLPYLFRHCWFIPLVRSRSRLQSRG
jgi:hypothetical protein